MYTLNNSIHLWRVGHCKQRH